MEELFREKTKKIRIYLAKEIETDPFEHTVELIKLNPLPIRAIVTDLIASQISWKMPGINTNKAKEILIESKYEKLLKQSQLIEIDKEFYSGWKQNGKLQYRMDDEGNYIRAYIYVKIG